MITVFSLLVGSTATAQQVHLMVTDDAQVAVPNANIWINGKHEGFTDDTGQLSVAPATETFRVRVSHSGHPEVLRQIKIDTIQGPVRIVMGGQRNLNEVVVTAGRRAESISAIPSSVSILNSRDIATQSQINTDISAVLGNSVPGLGVATDKGTNSGQTLRGRSVLVLIDGIPQSTPLMNGSRDIRSIDPSVIERIEVIKGATSIYGNGSAGGIINYITKKNAADAALVGGSTTIRGMLNPVHGSGTGGYRLAQTLYGRKNKFSYTASGVFDRTGLQRDANGVPLGQTDGLSNNNQYNAFLKLGYDIDDQSNLSLVYNFFNSLQHARYVSEIGKYGETPTIGIRGSDPGENTGTRYNHNAMLTYSRNNLFGRTSFHASAFYNTFRSMNRYVAQSTAWYGAGQTQINSEKKGLRIDLNTPFTVAAMDAEVTYGVDFLNDVTYQDLTDGRVYIPRMNMFNYAPFAQLTLNVTDNLILKGGARYEDASVKIKDFSTLASGPNNEGSVDVKGGKIPYRATTFNAGLRYNKYDFFNPFVSFSQGFTINELGRVVRRARESELENIQTDPIITNNYEAGFSSHFSVISFSAAYFISTSKLGVNLVADERGFIFPERSPERVTGYELSLDARLSPQWTIGGTYSYVEGKAKHDDGTEVYLSGKRIGPPKATAYLYYTPTQALDLQLFWVHTGSRDRFAPNENGVYLGQEGPVTAVDLVNLNASYRVNPRWSVGLGVSNLLNNDYYVQAAQAAATDIYYVKGNGMDASLNINYTF